MNTYIFVDYESTCCDKGSLPRDEMEIIEIGAVALGINGKVLQRFETFVKPVRHPVLTPFCKELTTITQEQVDNGLLLPLANKHFSDFISHFNCPTFCSWGYFDKKILLNNCKYHNIEYPFNDIHINIKEEFAKKNNLDRGVGLGKALQMKNLDFIGTPHRGIDDVINMVRLYKYIF